MQKHQQKQLFCYNTSKIKLLLSNEIKTLLIHFQSFDYVSLFKSGKIPIKVFNERGEKDEKCEMLSYWYIIALKRFILFRYFPTSVLNVHCSR